jgi:hypothetical protein
MADPTHSTGSGQTFTLPTPPTIQTGREIYDSIMGQIEPELVSHSLPLLHTKYKNETEEEKKARGERYRLAFIRYYKMFAVYLADMHTRMHRYQQDAMRSIEAISHSDDDRKLEDLAASLFSLE